MKSLSEHKCSHRIIFFFLVLFSLSAIVFPHGQEGYWVPADPPKGHYVIDARMDPEGGVVEGIPFRSSILILSEERERARRKHPQSILLMAVTVLNKIEGSGLIKFI